MVQLYSCVGKEEEEDNFLGDVHTCWKECLDTPNQWVINNQFKLTNLSYIHAKDKMKLVNGYIDMQCKFVPVDGEDIQIAYHKGEPKFIATIVEEGTVEVTLVQAILAKENKGIKDAKYKCDVKFQSIDEDELVGQQTASDDVYWERKYLADVKCIANKEVDSIYVKVYIDTPKHLVMTDTKVLGEVYINWSQCIQHPGRYLP